MRLFTSEPRPVGTGVVAPLLATVVLAALGATCAWLVDGPAAAAGVGVGALIVAVLFSLGMVVTTAVASLSPELSLLVALLTYALQLVLLVVVLTAIERSGLLVSTLDRPWTGGAVIVGALVWSAALARADMRRSARYHTARTGGESADSTEVSDRREGGTAG